MLRRTTHLLLVAFAFLAFAGAARAQDRAQQLLGQARQAAGIDAAAKDVATFAAKASVKTVSPQINMEIAADTDVELIVPDKFRKTQSISIAGQSLEVTTGVNGDTMLYDDGGRAAALGVDPTKGPLADDMRKQLKGEAFRLQMLYLLTLPRGLAFTASYAGEAEAPDGKADVVDVKGPESFLLRIFLDKQTHRLLMASYTVEAPDMQPGQIQEITKKAMTDNPGNQGAAAKAVSEAIAKMPRKSKTVQMRFSDYKKVNGVLFPHHMNVESEGQGQEDWTFSSFKLNPPLKPEKFEKK